MATRPLLEEEQASKRVKAIFDDIRQTRASDYINNFWRALAHDPDTLEDTWKQLKSVMGAGALDPLTKELIYIAVSAANGCSYCIHSHSAAARQKGMTEEQHSELVSIIGMAGKTNHLVTALQVPVDDMFLA